MSFGSENAGARGRLRLGRGGADRRRHGACARPFGRLLLSDFLPYQHRCRAAKPALRTGVRSWLRAWRRPLGAAVGLLLALACSPVAHAASTGYGAAFTEGAAQGCWGPPSSGQREHQRRHLGHVRGRHHQRGPVGVRLRRPPSAAITGIEVEVEGNDGTGATVTYAVQLSWNNGTNWTALQVEHLHGTADATTVLGGPADDWGHAPGPSGRSARSAFGSAGPPAAPSESTGSGSTSTTRLPRRRASTGRWASTAPT